MVLSDLQNKCAIPYIDNIIIHSPNQQKHLADIQQVCHRLHQAGLKLNPAKCVFLKQSVKYLGHVISPHVWGRAKIHDWKYHEHDGPLKTHHPKHAKLLLSEEEPTHDQAGETSGSQKTLKQAFQQPFANSSPRATAITRQVGVFIAEDLRPYSVVEKAGFQKIVKLLEPRYKVPSRQHFSTKVIPELYKETKAKLLTELRDAPMIALTTDGWTSRATVSYITITAHYMSGDDWKLHSRVLQTRALYKSHTGEHIGNVLTDALEEWNIKRPIQAMGNPVVTDNASNMDIAVREAGIGPHVKCFAHTINLATQRGLQTPAMERLLGRFKRIINYFHRSTSAAALLKEKQKMLQLPVHKLLIDVSTRWNSSYDMMQRFLEQQPAIVATLLSPELRKASKDIYTLKDDDISNAEEAIALLKPMKSITVILCDEASPTISLIHPLQHQILQTMTAVNNDSPMTINLKTAIRNDITKRYADPDVIALLLLCTCLDPRFRAFTHIDEGLRAEVYVTLRVKAIALNTKIQQQQQQAVHTAPVPLEVGANVTESHHPISDHEESDQSVASSSTSDLHGDSGDGQPARKKSALEDLFGSGLLVTGLEQQQTIETLKDLKSVARYLIDDDDLIYYAAEPTRHEDP
ncbi:PREDICTED: zinc finger BED domain-containing protein 1-like, partial [Priapulus caudatus]|uniref:Zinc finger BED domain-containing protein 1-like n=1 Tax=Priapulus caudatus TaxID=37621 RepID=A0ABM1EZY6_PRICU